MKAGNGVLAMFWAFGTGCLMPSPAWSWGATGHEWASGIAIEKLPDQLPAFVRDPKATAAIAVMGRELDRSRGAGRMHDAERDPGHFVDVDDNGAAMGAVPIKALPVTREEYDTRLRSAGSTQYKAGYLPYSIVDGWQQIVKDFAYWRAELKAEATATDPALRAWFAADRALREMLTLRDIGVWSHYVADASQPLHVSVHFNGWGDYPNPEGLRKAKGLHSAFESVFVRQNLSRAAVAAAVAGYVDCSCSIEQRTADLILASVDEVVPLYRLEKAGAFKKGDARGVAFTTARLAAGAGALRDMIVDAWTASSSASIGYPLVKVRDIESGAVVLTKEMLGAD
jgi:hypothetical protein